MKSKFATWLEQKYLDWQAASGVRRTIDDFATWIGAERSTVTLWLNDRRKPSPQNTRLLARRFGIDVYDALGEPHPDPDLLRIESVWDALPATQRLRLAEQAEEYAVHAVTAKPDHKRKSAPVKDAPA